MEFKEKIPEHTKKILQLLNTAGFEAYVVGGAVRDLLLGRQPDDFDVASAATPEEVKDLFQRQGCTIIDKLGNNFGCTVVVIDGTPTEITTFRGETYTSADAHRPAKVWYCKDLETDLKRRDFTVNAMAIDRQGKLYDYCGGLRDLEQKLLRPVGRAEERYTEDALRMFRACRLTAQLGFTYIQDEGQLPGFGQNDSPYYLEPSYRFPIDNCCGLSLARVRAELNKTLLAPFAGKGLMLLLSSGLASASCRRRYNKKNFQTDILPELEHLAGLKQNPLYHCYDVWEHTLAAIDNSEPDLAVRWAILLHDVGKGLPGVRKFNKDGSPSDHGHEAVSASIAEKILRRLDYDEPFVRQVVWLVSRHMRFAPMLISGRRTLLHWLRTEASGGFFRDEKTLTEYFTKLAAVFMADMSATQGGKNPALVEEGRQLSEQAVHIAANLMPVHSSDLDISGHELLELLPPEKISEYFAYLLERVRSGSLTNTKQTLLEAVKNKLARNASDNKGALNV